MNSKRKAWPDCSQWKNKPKNQNCKQWKVKFNSHRSKSLKPKDHPCCCLLSLSGLSNYLSIAAQQTDICGFQTTWNNQNIQNTSKPSLLTLPLIKCNSHLFFKRDFSSWVHMLNDIKESEAAVVFSNKQGTRSGSCTGLVLSWAIGEYPSSVRADWRYEDGGSGPFVQVLLNNHINSRESNLQVTWWMPSLVNCSFLGTRRIQYPGSPHFVTEYLRCWQGSRHTATSWSLQTLSAQACQGCNAQKSPTLWQHFTWQL